MTKIPKAPKTRDQGIGLNGSVNNEIVAVCMQPSPPIAQTCPRLLYCMGYYCMVGLAWGGQIYPFIDGLMRACIHVSVCVYIYTVLLSCILDVLSLISQVAFYVSVVCVFVCCVCVVHTPFCTISQVAMCLLSACSCGVCVCVVHHPLLYYFAGCFLCVCCLRVRLLCVCVLTFDLPRRLLCAATGGWSLIYLCPF